jgi:hypothetical protein
MNPSDPAQKFEALQLQHTQLLNEKLAQDLAKERRQPAWYQLPTQLVPIVTALVSVAGLLWGVVQYTNEQQKNRVDREKQSLREQETAEREFMKPWLESQRAIYLETLGAAATAANCNRPNERAIAEEAFWRAYQGRMILVETKQVSGSMKEFGFCLDQTETCSPAEKNKRVRALASAMAESMATTAKMSYQQFAQNQFRYAPPGM